MAGLRGKSLGGFRILEQIDEESNRVGAFIRRSVVAIEVTHKAASSQKDEDETGAGFLTTYLGRTFVITNYHVVDEIATKDAVRIYAANNEPFSPKRILTCPELDIAVLEIDPKQLPSDGSWSCCVFGDSSTVQVANAVFAVGSPFGLEKSVAYGHVSSLRRCNQDLVRSNVNKLPEYFQLDAAINPGNSGGPLINDNGQVIGMNTAKIVNTKYEGMGFSIPSNKVAEIVNKLIRYGYVNDRGTIGIQGTTCNLYESKLKNVPQGMVITSISATGALAGLDVRTQDIITAINGVRVRSSIEFIDELSKYKPGDVVTLSIFRVTGRETMPSYTFEVEVTLQPDN